MALDSFILTSSKSIPSMPSIALSDVAEEADVEKEPDSMNVIQQELQRLNYIYANLNWFTAHRTSKTSLIEEELGKTLLTIEKKTEFLDSLVQEHKKTRKNLYKIQLCVDIERHLTKHEKSLLAENKKNYEIMWNKIRKQNAAYPERHACLQALEAERVKFASKRLDLQPLIRNLEWLTETEKEARAIVWQQGKDVVAMQRALAETRLDKLILKKWIKKVFQRRHVWEQKSKKHDEQFEAKIKELEPVVEDEAKRVEASVACYEKNLCKLKRKAEHKKSDIARLQEKIATMNVEKAEEHARIREAKRNCFLLSQRLVAIDKTNPLREKWGKFRTQSEIDEILPGQLRDTLKKPRSSVDVQESYPYNVFYGNSIESDEEEDSNLSSRRKSSAPLETPQNQMNIASSEEEPDICACTKHIKDEESFHEPSRYFWERELSGMLKQRPKKKLTKKEMDQRDLSTLIGDLEGASASWKRRFLEKLEKRLNKD